MRGNLIVKEALKPIIHQRESIYNLHCSQVALSIVKDLSKLKQVYITRIDNTKRNMLINEIQTKEEKKA